MIIEGQGKDALLRSLPGSVGGSCTRQTAGRSRALSVQISLILALTLLFTAIAGCISEQVHALNGQGGKNFQFLGYRYLDEQHLQLWFDKNLPQSNADPAQFRIFKGSKGEGSRLQVAVLSSSSDKNQSISGMPTGSSYILELAEGESFTKGAAYTVMLSGTLVANNKISLGAYRSNEDVEFVFTVPSASGQYSGTGDPVIIHSVEDGATGVPVEAGLWFSLDRPAAHPKEVAKGIVLKENGSAVPLDPTLDAERTTGAVSYAAQSTDDGTFFFLPLSGSGGTVAYDLGFGKQYTLDIPAIATVDGRTIPAHSITFRTVTEDVPPPMNGSVEANWSGGNLQITWSPLAYTTGYNLYAGDDPYWKLEKVNAAPITGSSYQVSGISSGTTRYFRLTGVNGAGEGGISSVIRVAVSTDGTAAVDVGPTFASQGTQTDSLLAPGGDGVLRMDAAKAETLIKDAASSSLEADVFGFSESDSNAKEVRLPASVVTALKSAGKPFVLKNGKVTISVPAAALPGQYAWTLGLWKPAENTLPAKPKNTVSRQVIALKSVSGDTPLYEIDSPVTVTLPIPEATKVPEKLAAYILNADEGRWEYAGGKVDGQSFVFSSDKYTAVMLTESTRTFSDISGHWARQDIEVMAGRQIVNGTSDVLFSPQRKVTRAEFAVFLTRLLKLEKGSGNSGFTDVKPADWYAQEASAAAAAGIIKGDNSRFRPNDFITRQEMAVMTMRAYTASGGTAPEGVISFTDKDKLDSWAVQSVGEASALGLVSGSPDGSFGGQRDATRAEAVTMLAKLMRLLNV